MPDEIGRGQSQRLRVITNGRLITRGGSFPVYVENISETRALLTHGDKEPFTWCVLLWLKREFIGEMAWAEKGRCGIRFDEPLPAFTVLAIKRMFPVVDEAVKLPLPDRTRRI